MTTQTTRVLIVDDDPEFTATTARGLERMGYAVRTAGSGVDALEMIAREEFDVAVVDLNMPGMDGLTLLTKVRSSHPRMPIIIFTGYATVDTGIRGMEAGAADYLIKPVPVRTLAMAIDGASARSADLKDK